MDRNYTIYEYYNEENICVKLDLDPIKHKLFNNDTIKYEGTAIICNSPTRNDNNIAGILVLENNMTYGRKNGKGKLLYRCIPNDTCLPIFLIPYEHKKMDFNKVHTNHYITFKFDTWDDKHPYGIIMQNIGPVDTSINFYEYQLYCKNLHFSMKQFTKDAKDAIILSSDINDMMLEKYNIEDRTHEYVFSIDPAGSLDFDDAFSIKRISESNILLSIYISNVTIWIDILNLWESFTENVSTIYLPNKKLPLLPTILSDGICSLKANQKSFAFTLDILICENNNMVLCTKALRNTLPCTKDIREGFALRNTMITLNKNYCYEEKGLLEDSNYILLKNTCKSLNKYYKYAENINDSHDVVSYLMITMNHIIAKELFKNNNGIFRSSLYKKIPDYQQSEIPDELNSFLKIWNNSSSEYKNINSCDNSNNISHEIMGIDCYTHITSPIRRLVDILNMIIYQKNNNMLELSNKAYDFYNKWNDNIIYINNTTKKIRRVQSDCNLLNLYKTNYTYYNGYVIDINENNIMVYIPLLKNTFNIKKSTDVTLKIELYKNYQFKLYEFKNEAKLKNKIRLSFCNFV